MKKKLHLAVKEVDASAHNGGPIEAPLKPLDAIVA